MTSIQPLTSWCTTLALLGEWSTSINYNTRWSMEHFATSSLETINTLYEIHWKKSGTAQSSLSSIFWKKKIWELCALAEKRKCHFGQVSLQSEDGCIGIPEWLCIPEDSQAVRGHLVLKIKKEFCALNRASCLWNDTLNETLEYIGLTRCGVDLCLEVGIQAHSFVVITIYVDYMTLTSKASCKREDWLDIRL